MSAENPTKVVEMEPSAYRYVDASGSTPQPPILPAAKTARPPHCSPRMPGFHPRTHHWLVGWVSAARTRAVFFAAPPRGTQRLSQEAERGRWVTRGANVAANAAT